MQLLLVFIALLLLIKRRHCAETGAEAIEKFRDYDSPCDVPVPSDPDFRKRCHWIAPERDLLFCDPEFLLALSSVQDIFHELSNASRILGRAILDGENSVVINQDSGVAMVIIPKLTVENEWFDGGKMSENKFLNIIDEFAPCLPTQDSNLKGNKEFLVQEDRGMSSSLPPTPSYSSYPEFFAEILRLRWFQSDCTKNALILAIANLKDTEGTKHEDAEESFIPNYPTVTMSLSYPMKVAINDEIMKSIKNRVHMDLRDHVSLSEVLPRLISAIVNIAKESDQLRAGEILLINTGHVPRWAWITFMASFAGVAFLLFINWLVVGRIESRRSESSQRSTASSTQQVKKWKGGGLLRTFMHRKQNEGGGGGAAKPMQI